MVATLESLRRPPIGLRGISRMKRSAMAVFTALMLGSTCLGPLNGQERALIDLESGRVILNDWTYGFGPHTATNHVDGLLYVFDVSDPLVVMAIAVEDGSVVGRYGRGQGEGPGELRQLADVATTSDGVLVSDGTRVNYWRQDGTLMGSYHPSVPERMGTVLVCSLADQPVVPVRGGFLRRVSDGSWRAVGPGRPEPGAFSGASDSHVTCFGDVAYVLHERLWGYGLDGRTLQIEIPSELEEASRRWRESIKWPAIAFPFSGLSHDGRGRLFIATPRLGPGSVVGGIIDPNNGCYKIIADPDPRTRRLRRVMGVYRDSVIVAESELIEQVVDGVRTTVVDPGNAQKIALRPLRPNGGEPCVPEAIPKRHQVRAGAF